MCVASMDAVLEIENINIAIRRLTKCCRSDRDRHFYNVAIPMVEAGQIMADVPSLDAKNRLFS